MTQAPVVSHDDLIVIDQCCPLWYNLAARPPTYLDRLKAGGYTAFASTVGGARNAAATFREIGVWLEYIRSHDDLILVRTAKDIERAKREKKLGVIFDFQGTEPLEDSLDLVDSFKATGVGVIQLAYNARNRFASGSEEEVDTGLSRLGKRLIKRMNDARVIVDCAHTGKRSTLDAVEHSERTVIISHANCKAVLDISRNISDEEIKAIAGNGGVIGVLSYPPFVAKPQQPTLDDYINHIDHIANLVGIDHVGIALDYFHYQSPWTSEQEQLSIWNEMVEKGAWDPEQYTRPPWVYPIGIESPDKLGNLTVRLGERGYKADDIRKIMGGNWMRIYRDVWGE